ncbi:MAG: response regulator [Lachnospiraceae bacterium]|nr:response regulator [Lachnospiraceae bacterium]
MILTYYTILLAFSILFLFVLTIRWQLRIDIDFVVFFILIPLYIFGYLKIAESETVREAILANEMVYIGGSFLQMIAMLIVCDLCHIKLKPIVRASVFGLSAAVFLSTLTIGHNGLFYKSVTLVKRNGVSVLLKEYGPIHTVFYVMIVAYMFITLWALIYGRLKKPEASIKSINALTICMFISVFSFFGGRAITKDIEFTPASFILSEIVFLFIAHRTRLYHLTGDIASNVLENGSDGLIFFDPDKALLVANDTARRILPELKTSRTDYALDTNVKPFAEIYSLLDKFIQDGDIPQESMLTMDDAYYHVVIEHIVDGKRNVGYYVILRDITVKQKYLESVEKLNSQIQESANAAIAADNAKSKFLAQMSHEIRTPINAVLGMNEMILRESNDSNVLGYASGIETSGRTLLFLINSILDFSKIEDGKMEIVPVDYDTVPFIYNLSESISNLAGHKNIKFKVNVDSTLPKAIHGDDVRLNQVIVNLLSNAVKYTDEGSVTLNMKRSEGSDTSDDRFVLHVEVIDTGIGIKKEDTERMFQSFERLDITRNRNVEGTGLGMTIVYKLLELMDSQIHVESEYGKGSTFWFDIPLGIANPEHIGNYGEQASLQKLRQKKNITFYAPDAKILVVDDNALNIKVAHNFLKLCGIAPDEVMTGEDAIEMMRKKTYDIVFLDHMMPGMDGVETLNRLREESLIPDETVMIVFTANAIDGSREMYLEMGFDDYISKPVEIDSMVSKLEKYLNRD